MRVRRPGETDTVSIEVGDEQVWEELTLALSGLSAGQETTFTAVTSGHPAEEAAAGRRRPVVRDGKVPGARHQSVQERELPALDDELASR